MSELREIITATHDVPASEEATAAFMAACYEHKHEIRPLFPEDGRISAVIDTVADQELRATMPRTTIAETVKRQCTAFSAQTQDLVTMLIRTILDNVTRAEMGNNQLARRLNTYIQLWDPDQQRAREYWIDFRSQQKIGKAAGAYIRTQYAQFAVSEDQADVLGEAAAMILSEITQQIGIKKATITVVVSINPADILMMAYPTTGWGSCLALAPSSTGFNRRMAQSWALNPHGLVAFAYTSTTKVGSAEIPVRQWRQLLYADPKTKSLVFESEYPSARAAFATAAEELVVNLFAPFFGADPATKHDGPLARLSPVTPVYCNMVKRTVQFANSQGTAEIVIGKEDWLCMTCGSVMRDRHNRSSHICDVCRKGGKA